jgi:hypothetical protein
LARLGSPRASDAANFHRLFSGNLPREGRFKRVHHGFEDWGSRNIQKPFHRAAAVREILDGEAHPAVGVSKCREIDGLKFDPYSGFPRNTLVPI